MTDMAVLATRVRLGIERLNARLPRWRSILKRHRDEFNFRDGNYCVMGTLASHTKEGKALQEKAKLEAFGAGLRMLGLKGNDDEAHGFDAAGNDEYDEDLDALSQLWEAELDAER